MTTNQPLGSSNTKQNENVPNVTEPMGWPMPVYQDNEVCLNLFIHLWTLMLNLTWEWYAELFFDVINSVKNVLSCTLDFVSL